MSQLTRRSLLQRLAAAGAAGALSGISRPFGLAAAAEPAPGAKPRFLIVMCAAGGASMLDSLLAIRASESKSSATLNCFPDAAVKSFDGSPLRAVDLQRGSLGPIPMKFTANQSEFVKKHRKNMLVSTWTRTSVNHAVAQSRSVTGNEAFRGRTLQELVASQYGAKYALPNVHLMSGSGFTRRGLDTELPPWSFGEQVADPASWPLSLHGSKGIPGAPSGAIVDRARKLRDRLVAKSSFAQVFGNSERLAHWEHLRGDPIKALEAQALVDKLLLVKDSATYPLSEYGLASSPEAERLAQVFPNMLTDPLETQAAMAFLLLKYGLSVTVTIGPSFNVAVAEGQEISIGGTGGPGGGGGGGGGGKGLPEGSIMNPPIAFDFSHQEHRSVQAFMWSRLYGVMDKLITLLQQEEYADGESFWDRSVLYLASDFSRTKNRPANADEFGSGHDLNDAALVISPHVKGDRVLGGLDKDTGLTFGYDLTTGAPAPKTWMEEKHVYAGVLAALGVDTSGSGLPNMDIFLKA
jgi:hypothetical protein